ncbi:hypothetical protein [Fructilactobacillus fructivorans]|uniref:DUF2589 domain-containing protein n=1 Tax=Fructilactobacillus fructivorans TaxID=1614 RepID=A0A0C1LX05_9LACO|nr:hypothetical protein [Fructilactobacillus fructivorans]KID41140.1 hypothetical protein LfDm3_1286 [Fructilactobacillus fructivorans]MCT0151510.1 hypothetical protein [Fructilactobacillus fructivorans]MCT2867029.1 hypothetical protein [Fructilactobacillus fructivorans]MCT2869330.1 hypothetical protein [Fructilactobacillus fructivorans]MCT2873633.1 hypothetical protein [Fructilactobacillus fructivorans]
MEIDEKEFVEAAGNDDFQKQATEMTLKALEDDLKGNLKKMTDFIATNLKEDSIASASIKVSDHDIQLELQTSVINLPLDYAKNIAKITVGDGMKPINVYMIIVSPDVNRSKMRIDELADSTSFVKDPDGTYLAQFVDWTQDKLDQIAANEQDDKPSD